jgi:hypothetical protein
MPPATMRESARTCSLPLSRNYPHPAVVPTHHSQRAQCVPAARTAHAGLHLQGNKFRVNQVERPATVLVAAISHDFDGLPVATRDRSVAIASGLRL